MIRSLPFGLLLVVAACAGPRRASFGPTVPEARDLSVDRREARRANERAGEFAAYSDSAADRFLTERVTEAIEREVRREDAAREQRSREIELERARIEAQRQTSRGYGYAPHRRYRGYGPAHYIPWNTLAYGGIGAIIGHQSGHRDRGFAIGASIGLLQDLLRWR